MDSGAADFSAQLALQLIAHPLGGAEDDDAGAVAVAPDDGAEVPLLLIHTVHDHHVLRDVFVSLEFVCVADVHLAPIKRPKRHHHSLLLPSQIDGLTAD